MREIHKVLPDAKLLSEWQRQKLCEMIYRALLEVRILGWGGKAAQAADLADAFHNLPAMLWSEDFSLNFFRKFLESYQQKYSESGEFTYTKMLDRIVNEED